MKSFLLRGLLCFIMVTGLSAESLELVKRIGDDRDEYTFFRIGGATIGPGKQIYISDAGGYFIAMYDWEGKFAKRFGSFGQGPTDIQRVSNLQVHDDILYFVDNENRRLGRLRLDLSPLDPIRLNPQWMPSRSVVVADEGRIWTSLVEIKKLQSPGQVAMLDGQAILKHAFFTIDQFGEPLSKNTSRTEWMLRTIYGQVQVSAMPGGSQVLIGFTYPDNPARFYLYTEEGRELKKIDIKQPEAYRFAKHFTTYPFSFSSGGDRYLHVHLLPGNARGYWVHINRLCVFGTKTGDVKEQRYESAVLIHLDRNGEPVAEYDSDPKLEMFHVSDGGYVLGRIEDDETPCLRIYRIPGYGNAISAKKDKEAS